MEVIKILHKIIIFKMVVLSCQSVKISGDFNCFLKSFMTSVNFYTFNSPNFVTFPSRVLHSRSQGFSTHFQTHIFVFLQNAPSSSIWIHQTSVHLLISVQGFTLTLLMHFFPNFQTLAFSFLFRKLRLQIGVLKARSGSSILIHQTGVYLRPRSSTSACPLRHRSVLVGRCSSLSDRLLVSVGLTLIF